MNTGAEFVMKHMILLLCIVVLLSGCEKKTDAMDLALQFRQTILSSEACAFDAKITADYGNTCYEFCMNCVLQKDGSLIFTVNEPQSINGISGEIGEMGGQLKFDDVALAFPLLADEQLSPICGPWILMKTLRNGFITSAGIVDQKTRLIIEDSYQEDTLTTHIWLQEGMEPLWGEIYHNGYRILTIQLENFEIL